MFPGGTPEAVVAGVAVGFKTVIYVASDDNEELIHEQGNTPSPTFPAPIRIMCACMFLCFWGVRIWQASFRTWLRASRFVWSVPFNLRRGEDDASLAHHRRAGGRGGLHVVP